MKKLTPILLATASLLTACAMGTLAPVEVRKKDYVIKTKSKKSDAYTNALAHFAKSFGDANEAIKVKNESAGQIIAKGNVPCDVLPGDGLSQYDLWFSLDFQAKDNKARLSFEDLLIKYGSSGMVGQIAPAHFNIQKKEDVDKLDKCLKPLVDQITQAIDGGSKDW